MHSRKVLTKHLTVGRVIRSIIVPVVVSVALILLGATYASADTAEKELAGRVIYQGVDRPESVFIKAESMLGVVAQEMNLQAQVVDKILQAKLEAQAAAEAAARKAAQEAAQKAAARKAAQQKAVTAPAPRGVSTAVCPRGTAVEKGLTANTINVYRSVCANFPAITTYGGWRNDSGDHGAGKALDIMVSGDAGWAIANYLIANASALKVNYVIYQQKIYLVGVGGGWRPMEDRGSPTQNHFDHVHVSVN